MYCRSPANDIPIAMRGIVLGISHHENHQFGDKVGVVLVLTAIS